MPPAEPEALTPDEAERLLDQAEAVVPCLQMALADAKRLREELLAVGIPAGLGRDDHCTSGCSPKVLLLARQEDLPRVSTLLRNEWIGMVADLAQSDDQAMAQFQRGFASGIPGGEPEGDPPCPACGHVGALDDEGACSECGLVLA